MLKEAPSSVRIVALTTRGMSGEWSVFLFALDSVHSWVRSKRKIAFHRCSFRRTIIFMRDTPLTADLSPRREEGRTLKDAVLRILPRVQTPAQYLGGELNSVVKDHAKVRGKICLAFPDAYTLGMSHHGLQVLYTIMNNDPQWVCERAFTPWIDFEKLLRLHRPPLSSLEPCTPLSEVDVIGFSVQYEICYTNVLTMLDLGGIPLHAKDRTLEHPLVIAGGPGAQNPELLAPFVDVFIIGDGEESLPWGMERWVAMKERGDKSRADMLAAIVGQTTWAYAPQFYEPEY